jgi:hypothetical protein
MSFQNTKAFPALQATAVQQVKQATEVVKSPAAVKSTGTTPFVWAKLVNGEKKDLAAVQAEEKAKKEAAEFAYLENEKKIREAWQEQQLRDKLIKEGKAAEFNKMNAIRIAEEQARQKMMDEKYSRENGYWSKSLTYSEEDYTSFNVPKKVNEKSLEFVQLWLTNYPELAKITTLGDLQAAFYTAFIPWISQKHPRSVDAFETWEKNEYPLLYGENVSAQRYAHLQAWVIHEEKEYNTAAAKNYSFGISRSAPWAMYSIWIDAKQITWENCLFAMSKISGTFPNGLLEITGHYSKPTSQIKWVVSLEPYIVTRFKRKPDSEMKKKREQQREEQDRDDDDCYY